MLTKAVGSVRGGNHFINHLAEAAVHSAVFR
jgi:hypothetical protein